MVWNLVDVHINRYKYLYYRITLVSIDKYREKHIRENRNLLTPFSHGGNHVQVSARTDRPFTVVAVHQMG